MTDRVAYIDESYGSAAGHYLLAAVVVDRREVPAIRQETERVHRRHTRGAFHWHSEIDAIRAAMIGHVAARTALQLVVVCRPVTAGRDERARAACFAELLPWLESLDPPVRHVTLESRTRVLDKRDAARIDGLRSSRRLGTGLRFGFSTKSEPLLWLADAVAGAVGAKENGDPQYTRALAPRLSRRDIPGVP